jgi:phosphate uptake regulator
MERRKVQQVGGGTYTVSLPKAWAERIGITAGKTVHIDICGDDRLVIEPEPPENDVMTRLQLHVGDEPPHRLARTVRAAYIAGCEELVLTASEGFSRAQRRAVDEATKSFIGGTLIEDPETELTVEVLLDASEVSVQQSVRQLRFTALSMHRDAVNALVGEGRFWVDDRDDEADRLFEMIDRYCGRGLARLDEADALGLSRSQLFELRTAARELERVADHAETIGAVAERIDTLPDSVSAGQLEAISRNARTIVDRGTTVVVDDAGAEAAQDALDRRDDSRSTIEALDRELPGSTYNYQLGRALDALSRTAESGGAIAELGLRAVTRREGDAPAESPVPSGRE